MRSVCKFLCKPLAFLLIALCAAFSSAAAEQPSSPSLQEAAATAASLAQQYGGAASIQYALFMDGDIAYSGALGMASVEDAVPATDGLLYGIGSISKVYTAAAAMKLVDEGKLDLDTPVCTYLPDFTMADERYRDITMRMLLNHSSGLMFAGMKDAFLLNDPEDNTAAGLLLSELASQRLIADPGAYSVYCNTGFTLAQLVIERLTGMPLGRYLREALLAPAGLEDTFACQDAFDRERMARVYWSVDPTRAVATDSTTITGTGGLYATACDLARFGAMLCPGGGLLSEASSEAMAQREYARGLWPEDGERDALGYGLGWDTVHMLPFHQSGVQALCKGGDTNQYHAALVTLPEYGMAAAVLTSGGLSTYNQLCAARMLIDALAQKGVTIDEAIALPQAEPAPMPAELVEYSGLYGAMTGALPIVITPDGTLTLSQEVAGETYEQVFTYCDDGYFYDAAFSARVAPVTRENGLTYLYQEGYSPLPGLTVLSTASYACQKLPENPMDEETAAVWAARDGKRYFMLNAKYTSQAYALAMPMTNVEYRDDLPGYIAASRLVGTDRLEAVVQIPGTAGRDSMDMTFRTEDGVEYLETASYVYADESVLRALAPGEAPTIGEDGFARWYTIGSELDGQTMRVEANGPGSFAVYTADGTPVAVSSLYGDMSAALPAGGYAVFAGETGTSFDLVIE
ncbi:MAG: serine hydrolase domain-containing protein [Clostridia bacterium]|nr:serine hydrolase domain-containing protein [Clostridia bacterium]